MTTTARRDLDREQGTNQAFRSSCQITTRKTRDRSQSETGAGLDHRLELSTAANWECLYAYKPRLLRGDGPKVANPATGSHVTSWKAKMGPPFTRLALVENAPGDGYNLSEEGNRWRQN